jgi:hypothetical protein
MFKHQYLVIEVEFGSMRFSVEEVTQYSRGRGGPLSERLIQKKSVRGEFLQILFPCRVDLWLPISPSSVSCQHVSNRCSSRYFPFAVVYLRGITLLVLSLPLALFTRFRSAPLKPKLTMCCMIGMSFSRGVGMEIYSIVSTIPNLSIFFPTAL